MKPGRQNVILDIISKQNIETQNQLMKALAERGIHSTQATLSRDIRDLRLIKDTGPDGRTHYTRLSEPEEHSHNTRLQKILKESFLSFESAQNLVVIKTLPGLASGAASAFDSMQVEGLVGSIAGDDTIFLAMKTVHHADAFLNTLQELLDSDNGSE